MSATSTRPDARPAQDDAPSGAEIRLEALTKAYPGQQVPAVDALDLVIPAGRTVAFVGPSGCGKTTSLKMINRLIEPTSGRVLIGGEDVTRSDPTQLRRTIGYVVQGGGLMPHLSVAENVGLVPRLLKWDRRRIAARVDELLDLVGLDPAVYPIKDDQEFFLEALQDTKVMLVQGTGFNWPEPDHFRIVFLPHEADLREAINRLAAFLEKYRKRHGTDKPRSVQATADAKSQGKAAKAEKAA